MGGGLSGASVFRCQGDDGQMFALRAWPSGTKLDRIREVHRVVVAAATSCRALAPPLLWSSDDRSIQSFDGQYWEVARWHVGECLAVDAGRESILRGVDAIRQVHEATSILGTKTQVAPAVIARWERIQLLSKRLPEVLARPTSTPCDPCLNESLVRLRTRLAESWTVASEWIVNQLAPFRSRPVETRYVLRDVHRKHVLFNEGNVSGVIDYDAIRIDTPLTDLARWIGSFEQGGDPEIWWAALAENDADSPSSKQGENPLERTQNCPKNHEETIRLAIALSTATRWISLANWAVWIMDGNRFPLAPGENPRLARDVATRISELLRFCEPRQIG